MQFFEKRKKKKNEKEEGNPIYSYTNAKLQVCNFSLNFFFPCRHWEAYVDISHFIFCAAAQSQLQNSIFFLFN